MTTKKAKDQTTDIERIEFDLPMTVDTLRSQEALRTRTVPPEIVQTHPGKGGKVFEYVPHTYATESLLDVMGQWFSHDVLEAHIAKDDSAWALVRLEIHVPFKQPDGSMDIFTNHITEIGSFDGGGGYMSEAMMLGSAASRGLVKCMMRRFGMGLQFYKDGQEELTVDSAWTTIWRYVTNQLKPKDPQAIATALADKFKEAGLEKGDLLDSFAAAYRVAADFVAERQGRPQAEVAPEFKTTEPLTLDTALDLHCPYKGQTVEAGETIREVVTREGKDTAFKVVTWLASPSNHKEPTAEIERLIEGCDLLLQNWDAVTVTPEPIEKVEEDADVVTGMDDF
jgi:hypothetical protein